MPSDDLPMWRVIAFLPFACSLGHFVPPWTYNPEEGRGRKKPATKEQAMAELKEVVSASSGVPK